jgi:hypothetical protein
MEITVCVHTEAIPDAEILESLLSLLRNAKNLGLRPILCIMTPACPVISAMMKAHGVSEPEYRRRVERLSELSVVGYHGHMLAPADQAHADAFGPDHATSPVWRFMRPHWMPARDGDREGIASQMTAEISWLRANGISPVHYTAGWWFFPPPVVEQLVAEQFRFDFSVKVLDPRDTFGHVHRSIGTLARPQPRFWLNPERTLEEVPSVIGLLTSPARLAAGLVRARLRSITRGALFLHDYDLPGRVDLAVRNLSLLRRLPNLRWLDPVSS